MHISKIYLRVGKIPWRRKWQPTPVFLPKEFQTEEPGRLQFMGSQRVGHNRATNTRSLDMLGSYTFSAIQFYDSSLQMGCSGTKKLTDQINFYPVLNKRPLTCFRSFAFRQCSSNAKGISLDRKKTNSVQTGLAKTFGYGKT